LEVRDAPESSEMGALRVYDPTQLITYGLNALSVVPRAPNFSALRRVSSNFERA